MAYKVVFSANDGDVFRMMYEGFLATARGTNRQENRMNEKILLLLESISMTDDKEVIRGFDPTDPTSPKRRYLDTTRDGILIFEDSEFEHFKKQIDAVQCPAIFAKVINRVYDLIDSAEKGDAKTLVHKEVTH
jgi:hypothetical protein